MNATHSPSLTGATLPAPPAQITPEPPVRLLRLLLGLALAVAIEDFCFWDAKAWGFSVAVFFAALGGIILANREPSDGRRAPRLLVALLAGALLAATIETGWSNTLVLLALIVAIAGDTFFRQVESPWGRWLSQSVALVFAPGRIFWLGARMLEAAFDGGLGWTGGLIGGCLLALPALVLALIFGSLLASGNAIFGHWTNSFFDWFWKELALVLNPGRIALWCLIAFLILPLLQPSRISERWWKSAQLQSRLPEILPTRAALFSSGFVLLVVNLLFLVANIADALFLWSGQTLPVGVTYSGFVHHGVNSLIMTVILSAFVLVTIFQQSLKVTQRRGLRLLGLCWIAQNLFLLLSVALRLKLYIEAYDMTVSRLSVLIFLALVAAGYVLLTIKIIKEKSFAWLLGGCVLAVFATFYLTQFLDLAGWSANYNVARWEKDRTRNLDVAYLGHLGPAAWPAIHRAYYDNTAFNSEAHDAWNMAQINDKNIRKSELSLSHWREFSLRAWMNRGALDDKK